MANKELNSRIRWKKDTSSNWTSNNPVLLDGEIAIVVTNANETRFKVGDGTSTYTELPFDDEPIYNAMTKMEDALNTKADNSLSKTGTLLASAWTGVDSPFTQDITVTGLTATQNGIISVAHNATFEQREMAREAMLSVVGQEDGKLTIVADGELPDIDIPVYIILLG